MLEWHGYGKGGVRAPFRSGGRPTGETIPTPAIEHLDRLAHQLAAGEPAPRWVYLVGGPGNGKSETVEAFVNSLDRALGAGGKLRDAASAKFNDTAGVPRRVEIQPEELGGAVGDQFGARLGKLVLVQDASAMEVEGDAGEALCEDLRELHALSSDQKATYLCCVNRGVLADACRRAFERASDGPEFAILKLVIEATAFKVGTQAGARPSCWPTSQPKVACWPLDLESLFDGASSPGDRILATATDNRRWESQGACQDCSARELCPFRLNAEQLRQPTARAELVKLVRRAELASSERVNFRSALSLVAASIVGDWSSFAGFQDPCEWVHEQVGLAGTPEGRSRDGLRAILLLDSRLTAHALFPETGSVGSLDSVRDAAADRGCVVTGWFAAELSRRATSDPPGLRESSFRRVLAPLDPGRASPETRTAVLREVEDEFSQGVGEGANRLTGRLGTLDRRLLEWLAAAEKEWEQLPPKDAAVARRLRRFLRGTAGCLVKRAIGVRECHHQNEEFLNEYHGGLRSQALLRGIREPLQQVLGSPSFRFGMMDSFGRALSAEGDAIALEANAARLNLKPAPPSAADAPPHDSPVLFVDEHGIPLSFEVYLALRLQGAGCANSSLPPSVRASLDRVRHLRAGRACRSYVDLSGGTSRIRLGALGSVSADPGTLEPTFTPGSHP